MRTFSPVLIAAVLISARADAAPDDGAFDDSIPTSRSYLAEAAAEERRYPPNSEAHQAGIQLVPVERRPPSYPTAAFYSWIEGWVQLSFKVEPDGTTSAVQVIDSYPKGVFDRSAATALARWRYSPRNDPDAEAIDRRVVISFSLPGNLGISQQRADQFQSIRQMLEARNYQDAKKLVRQLSTARDLNFYEAAALHRVSGVVRFMDRDYAGAVRSLENALAFGKLGMAPPERSGAIQMLVLAYLGSGQRESAEQSYATWAPHLSSDEQARLQSMLSNPDQAPN
jgi:TonB family protein